MNNHKTPKTSINEATTSAIAVINSQEVLGKNFTVYGTFDNPLFLAKDVAKWIEHSNHRRMLESVDTDEKVVTICYTLGGNQSQWFLTEDGLYEVLMQSTKPIAKSFKKEVKKILKELRLSGATSRPALPTSEMVSIHRNNLEVLEIISEVSTSHLNTVPIFIRRFEAILNPIEAKCFRLLIERHKYYCS